MRPGARCTLTDGIALLRRDAWRRALVPVVRENATSSSGTLSEYRLQRPAAISLNAARAMIDARRRTVEVDPGTGVSTVWAYPAGAGPHPSLILAHGAGSNMDHPLLSFLQEALVERGIMVVKFNFPYTEAGRKAPDAPHRLIGTWRAVIHCVRGEAKPAQLFVGGRSMGGRIASLLAAEGDPVAGLVLLAYPLHPAGRTDALRAAHLPHIRCPMLFVQGTRDRLCEPALLERVLAGLHAPWTLHMIEGGDHAFKLPRQVGRTERQVWQEIVQVVASWLGR